MSHEDDTVGGKTLWLLRHAKASLTHGHATDHDRTLEPRGQRAATLIGAYLVQRGARPEFALCSSARRAIETLERVVAQLPHTPSVVIDEDLYLASPETLLERLRRLDEDAESAIVVGHNPGIADFARRLARRGDSDALERLRSHFPTGALAEIRFRAMHWGEIDFGTGVLGRYSAPKELV